MSRHSFASPLRPKLQTAKRFLSLQMSQAGHVLSDELNSILKSSKISGKKRRRIVEEIFTSEKSYQDHLNLITTLFLSPLRESSLLPDHVLNVIFSNIEAIQNVNRELLVHMETMGIGDAFLALAPFLRLYSTYANNFERALNTVKDWEKKCPKFASFKEKQENTEEAKGLKLNALLITPIQRIPRYKMLLENLVWKTSEDHTDFSKLQEAVDQISKVALHINENIRQHENFQKILSIQNSFSREGAPKLLAPGRVFIKEGTLLKVGKRGWRSAKERMFFLFSDILIYAKKSNEKDCSRPFQCLQVFPLKESKLHEIMGDGSTKEGGALFSIECGAQSLLLFSRSQGEAQSWLNEISKTIASGKTGKEPLENKASRAGDDIARRGIKRATARKVERKPNNGSRRGVPFNSTSAPYHLECLSPEKDQEMLLKDFGFQQQREQRLSMEDCKENQPCTKMAVGTSDDRCSSSTNDIKEDNIDEQITGMNGNSNDDRRSLTGVKRKLSEMSLSKDSSSRIKKQKSSRVSEWFSCAATVLRR